MTLRNFRDDLEAFLKLPPDVLLKMSELAETSDGFARAEQALALSDQTQLNPSTAISLLRTAEYLYDRVTDQGISVEAAIQQIVASNLEISITDEYQNALAQLLSYKELYETGRDAREHALAIGPHITGLAGAWSIRVHRTREDQTVRSAIMGLNVSWHDESGTSRSAFFQMTSQEWDDFATDVELLSEDRRKIEEFLG